MKIVTVFDDHRPTKHRRVVQLVLPEGTDPDFEPNVNVHAGGFTLTEWDDVVRRVEAGVDEFRASREVTP